LDGGLGCGHDVAETLSIPLNFASRYVIFIYQIKKAAFRRGKRLLS